MNKIQRLKLDMKTWLFRDDLNTIQECFDVANSLGQWEADRFYVRFAPYMAKVLDEELEGKK